MLKRYNLSEISSINLDISPGDIIFLHGDLATGKTTLSKHIINDILKINDEVKSPTYTYYNKYEGPHPNPAKLQIQDSRVNTPSSTRLLIKEEGIKCYHFDLYRLKNYDEFFSIGGEDILHNKENISIIEWPEIISKYYKPTIEIFLEKTDNENERIINIKYYK